MDAQLFESLLYRGESESLDFKIDQYSFEKATDEEKVELLKDILAFANSWRESDAYILIGVEEVKGGKSIVHGTTKHLNDHELQQFVNGKTKKPLAFSYEGFSHDGKQCGVIRIPVQERPVFLTKDFGRLKAGIVYIRRGSSTGMADPEEIAKMGQVPVTVLRPTFEVHVQPNVVQVRMEFFYCLEMELINRGTGTANELDVETTRVFDRFDRSLWEWRQSSPKKWRLKAKLPLHVGDPRHLAGWKLGNARLRPETLLQIQMTRRFDPRVHGSSYGDGDIHIELKLFAKDISPVTFAIEYTSVEINSKTPKEFSPVAGPS